MEIKVKAVESPDSKSVQEVEKELLEKHEESLNDEAGEANMEGVEQSTESATTTEEQEECTAGRRSTNRILRVK